MNGKRIVVDAHAWITYFEGGHKVVTEIIENNELHTSIFNVVEVASKAERTGQNAEEVVRAINQLANVYGVGVEEAPEIAHLHAEMKKKIKDFGLGDCFVLELAKRLDAQILTGDKHFKGLKNVIFVE